MRLSSKAFLVDPDGRLLLLDSTDPARPGTRWWELPGGGVEPGESELEALVREVLEETGLAVEPVAVGPLQWTQKASFQWLGRRHEVRLHGRVARVRDLTTAPTALTEHEVGTVLGQRWWSPAELLATDERFFPRNVPTLLPRLLAGERVDEAYDVWD